MDSHSLLVVHLGKQLYALPCEQVIQVDSPQTATPLPFVDDALEGLICIDKRPLLQIDLALALGLEPTPARSGKCLIVRLKSGQPLALHVTDVGRWIPSDHASRQSALPDLPLEALWPETSEVVATIQPEVLTAPIAASPQVPVLQVASAGKTVALLAYAIERIQHISNPIPASPEDAAASLLPTRSLANILRCEPTAPEDFSLLIRHGETAWRLTVEAVKGLSSVGPVYASAIPEKALWYFSPEGQLQPLIDIDEQVPLESRPQPRLWYLGPTGLLQELQDTEQLVTPGTKRPTIEILEPAIHQVLPHPPQHPGNNGIFIRSGDAGYIIPCAQVMHIERSNDTTRLYPSRFPQGRRQDNTAPSIPCINLARFLFGRKNQIANYRILIQEPETSGFWLEVDDVQPGTMPIERGTESSVMPLWYEPEHINLPYPANALFTGAYHEEKKGQWILKIRPSIRFGHLPWRLKKALIRAISGWQSQPESNGNLSPDTAQNSSD